MIYISQLLETPKLENLLRDYPVGLEVISFSIGYVLDQLEESMKYYKKDFSVFDKEVPLTFHGPFLDLLPGSCDSKVRSLAEERFESGYKAAQAFGVNQMIFHTGYMPHTYPDRYWLENTVDFWKDFLKDKIETCTFYIENVLDLDYKLIKQLVEAINHPHFKVCLDVGHVQAYSKVPVQEWILGLGEHIGYVHLHNNDGTQDAHRGLLDGTLPMEAILTLLKKEAPKAGWSLEISDEQELRHSLDFLIEKGFL